ncbi:MAG: dihydropteroate synthase [Alphaproteobacteria bacterium]|nr:dihydropteroate synthase [Alphaproteobacteria bacterium]
MTIPNLTVIGERINPGFRSSKALFDNEDLPGIQALAKRQADAGASYLNVNIGTKALDNPHFMKAVIEAIQAVVSIPLSFDFPQAEVQEICLKCFDQDKAGGHKPIINSVAETRLEMLELLKIRPFKLVVMASERLDDGVPRPNKKSDQVVGVARRMAERLTGAPYGMALDDILIDVSISLLASDTEGLTRMAIDAIRTIGADPALKGIHMMGGLSNISGQLPAKAADGSNLKLQLEEAFLTLTVPYGFDTILATPWKDYSLLPDDNPVLCAFKDIVALDGFDAMRRVRTLYTR